MNFRYIHTLDGLMRATATAHGGVLLTTPRGESVALSAEHIATMIAKLRDLHALTADV